MYKKVEEMTERERLMELVREKRKLQIYRYVKIVLFIIITIIAIHYGRIYIPQMIEYFKEIKENVDYLNKTLTEIRTKLDSLEKGTGDGIQAIRDFLDNLLPSSWFH